MTVLPTKPKDGKVVEGPRALNNKPLFHTPNANCQYLCGSCSQVLAEVKEGQLKGGVYRCTNPKCGAFNQID